MDEDDDNICKLLAYPMTHYWILFTCCY